MKFRIVLFVMMSVLLACNKENAKKEYEMYLHFESNDHWKSYGRIFEKKKDYGDYEEELADTEFKKSWKKNQLYFSCFDGMIMLKYNNVFGGNGTVNEMIQSPVHFAADQTGNFQGSLVLEGAYSQKKRAYTVESGTFQFYWSNAEDFGLQDTVLTGTWSLKRK